MESAHDSENLCTLGLTIREQTDALAAVHFLQGRNDINSRRVGLWGSSEGGMLATQVAARSKDIAFIIDSSGFMGPLGKTVSYQIGAVLRSQGLSKSDIEEATAFTDMWLHVARTGQGWDEFVGNGPNCASKTSYGSFSRAGILHLWIKCGGIGTTRCFRMPAIR
jgi:hypothetical protein